MSSLEPVTEIEVDARGLLCPLPVIRLAEAAREAPGGTRITILASDPAARHDIPAWCRMRGHTLLQMTEVAVPSEPTGAPVADPAWAEGNHPTSLRCVVQVQAQPSKAAGSGS